MAGARNLFEAEQVGFDGGVRGAGPRHLAPIRRLRFIRFRLRITCLVWFKVQVRAWGLGFRI